MSCQGLLTSADLGAARARIALAVVFAAPLLWATHAALADSPLPVSPRLPDYRLDFETPPDGELQRALEAIDRRLASEHGIPDGRRACGVLDLRDLRLALVEPDRLFYAASVPKICVVLAWLEAHPEAVDSLAPAVRRELELVLKRSDNDLAAKYSRLVGLDAIQTLQRSERYGFYDASRGGGLWCGKHYGQDEPRTGDPVGDLSHAATVRQCLRYYLLLEQGRLISPAGSRLLRELFEAPGLDFHHDNFVDGLRGRDVAVIRKNGLWERWHLDTARVERRDRVYLIAAIVEHEAGPRYLADLAAAVDDLLGGSRDRPRWQHDLVREGLVSDGRRVAPAQRSPQASIAELWTFESAVARPAIEFDELLPSWNVRTPEGTGVVIEARVGRAADGSWSPWLDVGEWGLVPVSRPRVVEWDSGKVDVDYVRSRERHDRAQLRVTAYRRLGDPAREPVVDRLALAFSDSTGLPRHVLPSLPATRLQPPSAAVRRLSVPFRSQRTERPEIAGRICSPTSVSMVLEYRGVGRSTLEVAQAAYDARHDLFGNWPRAVQAAASFGVPGHIRRFGHWTEVEDSIAADQPLIVSIRAAEGELRGAPYPKTNGHLLVLVGFDVHGDVLVNDPAAATAEAGRLTYRREDLDRVWLARGGTAYVLTAP